MNILAIDPSLRRTAICIAGETLSLDCKLTGMMRLEAIREQLVNRIEIERIDLAVIEGYSMGSSLAHSHELGELGGIIRWTLWGNGIPFVEVPPSSLKKYLTGKGNADKDLMLSTASRRFDRTLNNDEADALALWAMAMDAYGQSVLSVPESHREALTAIEWPVVLRDGVEFAPVVEYREKKARKR